MKLRKAIALVLAALLLCGAMMCTASADAEYRAKQMARFEEMKNRFEKGFALFVHLPSR